MQLNCMNNIYKGDIEMSESNNQFFKGDKSIEVVKLYNWLDWASGSNQSVFVGLPMIQRGSVWKPKQIIDLWDTLLRGMPVGSLMAQNLPKGTKVRRIGQSGVVELLEAGLGLLDGQQRTLSMLIPWAQVNKDVMMGKKIWVALGDKQQDDQLFSLRVTTQNHPFGFDKNSPNSKLSLDNRRKAREEYFEKLGVEDDRKKNKDLFLTATPYGSVTPIELSYLIKQWRNCKNTGDWINSVMQNNKQIDEKLKPNLESFAKSLEKVFKLEIPIIAITDAMLGTDESDNNNPPLAVLFQRVGTGGTSLTDEDYAYSIIKHRLKDAYGLVEALYNNENSNIASLLSETDLVMTAVRLAAAEFKAGDKPLTDYESLNKQQFHTLLKHEGDFLAKGLLPMLQNTGIALTSSFEALSKLLEYRCDGDIGLPKYALVLLTRPLLQVLLRWVRIVQSQHPNDVGDILETNRKKILSFALYWSKFLVNAESGKQLSALAFKELASKNVSSEFPVKEIYNARTHGNKKLAFTLFSPKKLKALIPDCLDSPEPQSNKFLRGWKRFELNQATENGEMVAARDLYHCWWGYGGYVHPILLWLQRKYVYQFEGNPIVGQEDETPYDYDHICPSSHWTGYTGITSKVRILDFLLKDDEDGHWRVGNSIGNLRVWNSVDNRHDGDASSNKKLKLLDPSDSTNLLNDSAISNSDEYKKLLIDCSVEDEKKDKKVWDESRVLAFQVAVEKRAFELYETFYNTLDFADWSEDSEPTSPVGN